MAKNRVTPQNVNKKDIFVQSRDKPVFKDKLKQHSSKFHKVRKGDNSLKTSDNQKGDNFFVIPNLKGKVSKSNDKIPGPSQEQKNLQPSDPTANTSATVKKPFDKKAWRLKKYSKKYKLQQWEDNRKKAVLKEYYKSIKDDEQHWNVEKIYENFEKDESNLQSSNETETIPDKPEEKVAIQPTSKLTKKKVYKSVQEEFKRIRDEKQKAKEEAIKTKNERSEAIKEYKMKKTDRYKKLNRKTRKGQPIMKDRIEMMLESIQKSIANS